MKSPEMHVVPRSMAIIAATGALALASQSIDDQPTAHAYTHEECDIIGIKAKGGDGITGSKGLTEIIQKYAVNEYVEAVGQADPADLGILRWNTAHEINNRIAVGDIPMPARDGNTYHVCISPDNPEHISVTYTQKV